MVLDVAGESITGYLSSRRVPVPVVNPNRRPWTDDEDAHLRNLRDQLGPRWKIIGLQLGRAAISCKNRCLALDQIARNRSYEFPELLDSLPDCPYDAPPDDLDSFLALFR